MNFCLPLHRRLALAILPVENGMVQRMKKVPIAIALLRRTLLVRWCPKQMTLYPIADYDFTEINLWRPLT